MHRIGIAFPNNLTYTALVQAAIEEFFAPFSDCQIIPLYSPGFPNLLSLKTAKFDALIVRFTDPKHMGTSKNSFFSEHGVGEKPEWLIER